MFNSIKLRIQFTS